MKKLIVPAVLALAALAACATTPETAQSSMTGVITPAAAATPPPRPPCTYSGTYVSSARNPIPKMKLATSDGPIARRMNRLGGRMGLPVRRSFQTKNAADAMTTSASGDATYHDHPSGPRRETSTSSVPAAIETDATPGRSRSVECGFSWS